mmetsp:Transcript_13026/g.22982  ORF Transcript_13026/g.22982 Transcript_13026/m.22982 type:complete len:119 (-) Transcript_13026:239-595(-)
MAGFCKTIDEVWSIRWDNQYKEPLWRLAVQGVAGAGGHDICMGGVCPCGWQQPVATHGAFGARLARVHYIWECAVAEAVLDEVQACLFPGVMITREDVLLAQSLDVAVSGSAWQCCLL